MRTKLQTVKVFLTQDALRHLDSLDDWDMEDYFKTICPTYIDSYYIGDGRYKVYYRG